jgi:tyrosyl-tRNA synthetase
VTATKLHQLKENGFKIKILLADVHTMLNQKGARDWIDQLTSYWRECFKGFGLEDAEYVRGSEFQFEKDYIEDVLSLSLDTTMNRSLRSMQEVARDIENAKVSQVIYPLMQAVDIKALKVDVAYGGLEQRKIHMLAREGLPSLEVEKPVCIHTPLLCSLQGPDSKMSSSQPETLIAVEDEPKTIKNRVNSAYCPPEVEGNPVIDICRLIILPKTGKLEIKRPEKFGGDIEYGKVEEIVEDYTTKKLHPADLKNGVSETVSEILKPLRKHLADVGISYPKKE